jgi:hypothetical protein
MPNFSELMTLWLFLGAAGLFYGIQVWFVDFLLSRFKESFDISRFFTPLYLFLIWFFAGEFMVGLYLYDITMQ